MNPTLAHFINKFGLTIPDKMPCHVTNVTRTDMAKFIHELDFKVGAEIGVAQGWYSEILCRENPQAKLYSIDVWDTYKGYNEYTDRIGRYYEAAKKLLEPYNCELIKKFSMDAVNDFEDNSLDFVFIDGAHDFKNVAMDIYEWTKKVHPGGIVFGHDYKRWKSNSHVGRRKYLVDVKDVVQAFMYARSITPWFALENEISDPKFGRDNPCWMFVRQEKDLI
jgi:predicted O-methyltransferase YrrM